MENEGIYYYQYDGNFPLINTVTLKEKMNFREMQEQDAQQLSSLASYVWCNTYCKEGIREIESQYMINEFNPEKFIEILKCASKTCIVAEDDKKIQGLCILNLNSKFKDKPEFGDEISNLYVFPELQRKGIGHKLLQSAYRNFGPNKWLTTWVHNYRAINFYKKNNFAIIGSANFNLFGEVHQNHVLHHN